MMVAIPIKRAAIENGTGNKLPPDDKVLLKVCWVWLMMQFELLVGSAEYPLGHELKQFPFTKK